VLKLLGNISYKAVQALWNKFMEKYDDPDIHKVIILFY